MPGSLGRGRRVYTFRTCVYPHLRRKPRHAYLGSVIRRIFFFLLLLVSTLAAAAPKTEKIGAFTEGSEKLNAALQSDGYRIYLPNTLACCDVWLAKKVATGKSNAPGANYPEFHESEFLGVINFPKGGGGDFRGQTIKAGSYTMRYELLPSDGNHMGVAPYPDMVLLIPVADDPDPDAKFDFAKMVELSAKAAGTAHPAAFEMMPAHDGQAAVFQTDDGWVVFQAEIATDSGNPLKVAFVVKGSGEQ